MADHDLQSCDDWPAGTVLVQAATYNERENLPSLIEAVLAASPELQLLIIDDSSPDGTGDVALRLAEHNARLHVLVRGAAFDLHLRKAHAPPAATGRG
jgi:hypothetical protein